MTGGGRGGQKSNTCTWFTLTSMHTCGIDAIC